MENHTRRMVTRSTSNKYSTQTRRTIKKVKSTRPRRGRTGVDDAPIGDNAKGLPALPDELLLEIMSPYPVPKLDPLLKDIQNRLAVAEEANKHSKRRDTLTALSQTCRNLRRFFRPYVWTRIEVCYGMYVAGEILGNASQNHRKFNCELVRQLEIVTVRDPSLAQYVKLLNVEVTNYSTRSILAKLARCIALFPNLRLVKLRISLPSRKVDNQAAVKGKAFSRYSYPQIHHVIVSRSAFAFLLSCPSVKSVDVQSSREWPCRFEPRYLKGFCPHLENLAIRMAELASEAVNTVETLQAFPKLRTLALKFDYFDYNSFLDVFTALETLKHLKAINFVWNSSISKACTRHLVLDFAVQLLRKLQKEDREEKVGSLTYAAFGCMRTERICLSAF
ncbi:hypothetical protein GALMADRAFT_241923 [Galerina marginata CBS 339.88]|uniref:Uncharacterized protein n=1 Tax=Galerina marginata (strain CBS 339.88) TaxID=685588 RepID=A0A067T9M6_GALM3|nr:hypothetical protein GALMADRAFT_241923 [Galerina marginata CBS 339.88]